MTVKGCYTVLPALLLILTQGASAADNWTGATRELAVKSAAYAGARDPVALTFRNLSSLAGGDVLAARRAFEAALKDSGVHVVEPGGAAIELRLTLSENLSQYLLVVEARRGDERQVWICGWPRAQAANEMAEPAANLEKKLLWEQSDPILDAAETPDALLVLSSARVTLFARQNGAWEPQQAAPVSGPRPWPRDLRGHIRVAGPVFRVFLPGVACSGSWQPALEMQCKPSEESWVLESGAQSMLLATYASTRNHFDGRVTTQAGVRKSVASFYSAAAVEDSSGTLWLLAGVDGRTQILDANFTAAGAVANWGSDIAGPNVRCGGSPAVLATRPDESNDAVQAFSIANRDAQPLSAPLAMPGPVTALWAEGMGAIAVTKDSTTGKYAAYRLTLTCGS